MYSNQSYQAQAFHPDLVKSPAVGELIVTTTSIVFKSAEIEIQLPLQGLQLREGGTDRLVFFSHVSKEHCEICIKDRRILDNPILLKMPSCASQLASIKNGNKKLWLGLVVTAVVLAIMTWGLFAVVEPLADMVAQNIPAEWEQELGKNNFEQIKSENKVLETPELKKHLDLFTHKLTDKIKDSPYPFTIAIINDSNVNAFALPGGYIIINSGLIEKADSGEEVLGVLGHEIAHVTRQHGIRSMIKSVGIYVIIQALLGDGSGLLAVLADAAPMLLAQKYSRDFEREADQVGLQYLVTAKINPEGMVSFFKKLQQHYKETGLDKLEGTAMTLLSTHPATSERIDNLTKDIKRLEKQNYQSVEIEFQQLKQLVKK